MIHNKKPRKCAFTRRGIRGMLRYIFKNKHKQMKNILLACLLIISIASCKKDHVVPAPPAAQDSSAAYVGDWYYLLPGAPDRNPIHIIRPGRGYEFDILFPFTNDSVAIAPAPYWSLLAVDQYLGTDSSTRVYGTVWRDGDSLDVDVNISAYRYRVTCGR